MTDYSMVILAGGRSQRMGFKKGFLTLSGKTFLDIIIDKAGSLGIDEIILSGPASVLKERKGVKVVEDEYIGLGPLAGIHAGLIAATCPKVFVMAEDSPLVPEEFIKRMIREHEAKNKRENKGENEWEQRYFPITVAACTGQIQPLLGIYDKSLIEVCARILNAVNAIRGDDSEIACKNRKARVMTLLEEVGYRKVLFEGEELLIRGCNTQEEYEKMISYY